MREQPRTKKISWKKRRVILLAAVLTLLLLNAAVGALAAYRTQNIQKAEMISANFHISSNYLKETAASYNVVDWGGGFDILLYNYETENIANISAVDMTYTVTVENGSLESVKNATGDELSPSDGSYSFPASTGTSYHTLHILPDDSGGEVSVTVETTAPFTKTLSGSFTMIGKTQPSYTAVDQGDGSVLLTISANDYDGTFTVKWNSSILSPDNAYTSVNSGGSYDALEAAWMDAAASTSGGTLTLQRNSTYLVHFVKNNAAAFATVSGDGTTANLLTE